MQARGDRRGEQHAPLRGDDAFRRRGHRPPFAEKTASLLGLPIVCTTVPDGNGAAGACRPSIPRRSPRAHAVGIVSDTLVGASKKRRKKRCQKVKTCTRPTGKAPSPCVQRPLRRYSEETTLKGRFVRTLKSLPRLRPVPRRLAELIRAGIYRRDGVKERLDQCRKSK